MYNLEIFDLSSEEEKSVTKEHLAKCLEGFEIEAEYRCRLAVIDTYIDYATTKKKLNMTEVRSEVNSIVSKMIERYNCGSAKLLSDVDRLIANKFKPKRALECLAMAITKSFQGIDVKYSVPKIRAAIESLGKDTPTGVQVPEAVTLGMVYFEKYGKDLIEQCFSEDFRQYLIK